MTVNLLGLPRCNFLGGGWGDPTLLTGVLQGDNIIMESHLGVCFSNTPQVAQEVSEAASWTEVIHLSIVRTRNYLTMTLSRRPEKLTVEIAGNDYVHVNHFLSIR